ncbi:MAG: hypothetical protein AAGI34_13680, partial [Pseudomonadota bacterium]
PEAARLLSLALCRGLPDLDAGLPPVRPAVLKDFAARMGEAIAADTALPATERYRLDAPPALLARFVRPDRQAIHHLSAEQIDIIARVSHAQLLFRPKRRPIPAPAAPPPSSLPPRQRSTADPPRLEAIEDVLIHIGDAKTGSSYIQSALACSVERLASEGIHYPLEGKDRASAVQGRITSGNIAPKAGGFTRLVRLSAPAEGSTRLLLSNENLCFNLFRSGLLDEIERACPRARLRVLAFVRDPVDHAVSLYQQTVKRSGASWDFDAFAVKNYNVPRRFSEMMATLRARGLDVTVLNYARHREGLLGVVETWLGVARGTFVEPPVARINRSTTNAELVFQRVFNRYNAASDTRVLSDMLCHRLPDLESEDPPIGDWALRFFVARMRQDVARSKVLEVVPAAEGYAIETYAALRARFPRPGAVALGFSEDQMDTIARVLAALSREPVRG